MFEVPNAKRVKRSEAISPDHSSSSLEPAASQTVRPDYGFDYDFVTLDPQLSSKRSNLSLPQEQQDAEQPSPDNAYEFRLFTSTTPSTFVVRPATPTSDTALSAGRFVHPSRPDCFYFTSGKDPSVLVKHRHEIALSAVSSDEIFERSSSAWPGTSLPWRVIHLYPSAHDKQSFTLEQKAQKAQARPPTSGQMAKVNKRTKPNKKRRIALRQRLVARSSLKQQAADAEEAERLKRNTRNREKKVKRRERDRKRKAKARAQDGAGDAGVDVGADGSEREEEEEGEEEVSRTQAVAW